VRPDLGAGPPPGIARVLGQPAPGYAPAGVPGPYSAPGHPAPGHPAPETPTPGTTGYPQPGHGSQPHGHPGFGAWRPEPAPAPPRRSGIPIHVIFRLGVLALIFVIGGVGWAMRQSSVIPGGRSTDGVFATGDCVTLTHTYAGTAPCSGSHDAKIVSVIHGASDACPGGSDHFRVDDGTGDLCLDINDHSP
jgi:hypothetical protein